MQQKPSSIHQELTPKYPATSLPDSVQHKESDPASYRHPNLCEFKASSIEIPLATQVILLKLICLSFLDPPCGHSVKPAKNLSHFNRSCTSDLYKSPYRYNQDEETWLGETGRAAKPALERKTHWKGETQKPTNWHSKGFTTSRHILGCSCDFGAWHETHQLAWQEKANRVWQLY